MDAVTEGIVREVMDQHRKRTVDQWHGSKVTSSGRENDPGWFNVPSISHLKIRRASR